MPTLGEQIDIQIRTLLDADDVLTERVDALELGHARLLELFDAANQSGPTVPTEPTPEPEPEPTPEPPTPGDGGPITVGQNIVEPGSYTLFNDVSGLSIGASNVAINLNGYHAGGISIRGSLSNIHILDGRAHYVVAEGQILRDCVFDGIQGMIGRPSYGEAFLMGGHNVSIMNCSGDCSSYGVYFAGGSNLRIDGCNFNSIVDQKEEAVIRLEGVESAVISNSRFESHTKYCVRAHGVATGEILVSGCELVGRWFQFGNHSGDVLARVVLDGNTIRLDQNAPYSVIDRRTVDYLQYTNNRHIGFTGSSMEDAYGDMVPQWRFGGNTYE